MSERFVGIDGAFLQGYDKGFKEGFDKGRRYMEELFDEEPQEVDLTEEQQKEINDNNQNDTPS